MHIHQQLFLGAVFLALGATSAQADAEFTFRYNYENWNRCRVSWTRRRSSTAAPASA
jgi:hypothetical protein